MYKLKIEEEDLNFVRKKFSEYYTTHLHEISAPTQIEKREFGFTLFAKEAVVIRHKSFNSLNRLRQFIKQIVPSGVYYSSAYYENPEAEMGSKGWLGSDLIFDIDSSQLARPCIKDHDEDWVCKLCLEAAKKETSKLLELLIDELGFAPDEIKVIFSGHRGYHVHVESEKVRYLDQLGRAEIVDFARGVGLDVTRYHGFHIHGKSILVGPSIEDKGWRGRIARGVYEILLKSDKSKLKSIGLREKEIKSILQHRDFLLRAQSKRGFWHIKGLGIKSWMKIINHAIKHQAIKIDPVVTTDVHRLIRLPNTLHGKSGMKAIEVTIDELKNFDPLSEAIAFGKDSIKLYITKSPRLMLGDYEFGPFEDEVEELPMAAGIYLILRGVARVLDEL